MNGNYSGVFGAVGTVTGVLSLVAPDPASVQAIAAAVSSVICAAIALYQAGRALVEKIKEMLANKK